MVTITLTRELEELATEQANRQGTTPELWTLDKLRQLLQSDSAIDSPSVPAPTCEGDSMRDFFAGYVGVLHSSELVPGGAQMSQQTGQKFAEGMLGKRRRGKL